MCIDQWAQGFHRGGMVKQYRFQSTEGVAFPYPPKAVLEHNTEHTNNSTKPQLLFEQVLVQSWCGVRVAKRTVELVVVEQSKYKSSSR